MKITSYMSEIEGDERGRLKEETWQGPLVSPCTGGSGVLFIPGLEGEGKLLECKQVDS